MAIIKYVTGENLAHAFGKVKALVSNKANSDLSNVDRDALAEAMEEAGMGGSVAAIAKLVMEEDGVVSVDNQLAEIGGEGAQLDGYATEDFVHNAIQEAGGIGGDKVGDIKITARTDLGDKWLLCNGVKVSREVYEALGKLIPPNLLDEWDITQNWWSGGNGANIINCIIYVDGYWVVGGRYYDGTNYNARIAYTTDLAGTWTTKDLWSGGNGANIINCITYAEGNWVVGGRYCKSTNYSTRIAYATDLAGTWTTKGLWDGGNDGNTLICIAYANGYWVVGGRSFSSGYSARIAYTTDLAGTWTTKDLWNSSVNINIINCITYVDGYWVVGGGYCNTTPSHVYYARIAYTTDLAGAWTTKDLWIGGNSSTTINCIVYADGKWVAGGKNGNTPTYYARIAYATDLAGTWTTKDLWSCDNSGNTLKCIAYADGYWVAVGCFYSNTDGHGFLVGYDTRNIQTPVISMDKAYVYIKAKE